SATVPPAALSAARARRARRARWLAPLGAAAAVAALLGVATLASRDDSSGGDAASSAPAETEAATFEATTSAAAADAGRTEAQALSGDETLDSPAAGRAAGAATLPQLGSFRTLDELASQLEEADGAATLAAPTSLPSVAPPAVPTTPPAPATDCAEGVPLGEATLAGQPVTV